MKGLLKGFFLAVQLLSRLPTPTYATVSAGELVRSATFYPLVGALLGGLLGLLAYGGERLGLGPPLLVALLLTASALLTGALHEDGLADAADGLGGGSTPEKVLLIMRDSRIGSYGGLAITLSVALRAGALLSIPVARWPMVLVLALCASRAAALWSLARLGPARADDPSLASRLVRDTGTRQLLPGLSLAALVCGGLGGAGGALGLGAALGVAALFSRHVQRRLGGTTGDLIGATAVIGEVAALVVLGLFEPVSPFVLG